MSIIVSVFSFFFFFFFFFFFLALIYGWKDAWQAGIIDRHFYLHYKLRKSCKL